MDHYQSDLYQTVKKLIYSLNLIFLLFSIKISTASEIFLAPSISVGLLQPLEVGLETYCTGDLYFCNQQVRGYIDSGYVWIPVGNQKSLSLFTVELGSRLFVTPTGPFFIGLGLGYRHIGFQGDLSILKVEDEPIATKAILTLDTMYVASVIGLNFSLGANFFIQCDLGLDLPIYSTGKLMFENSLTGENSDNSKNLAVDSSRSMGRIAGLILPRATLFRFLYYF